MTAPADFSSSLGSTEIDAAVRRIGVVYAKALYQSAQKAGVLDEVASDFEALMQVLEEHPTFLDLFRSGMIANEDKAAMIQRTFEGKASKLFVSFMRTVGAHGRATYFRAIYRSFRELNDERIGQVRVQVTTAAAFDGHVRAKLEESLQKSLGRKPILEMAVDPSLIGGVMLRVGDTVYDASIASQRKHSPTNDR